MSMYAGLSGINAATADINVTANNIANVSTTGFKSSRAEFGDLVTGGIDTPGLGVQTQAVNQQFQQGNPTVTGNASSYGLDLRIAGNGFFQVKDATGTYYTRAGSFHTDADGNIVNNLGQKLQGTGGDLKFDVSKGPVTAISMDSAGNLTGTSGGVLVTATGGPLGLANFPNVQGLQQANDAEWLPTGESGAATALAAPGTNNLGTVEVGQLEASNVDLTAQLVNMIIAQRNFQANAQTITTNNTMAQTIINIR